MLSVLLADFQLEEEGEFIKINRANHTDHTYKMIQNVDITELKTFASEDEYCLGFSDDGMMKFYIDPTQIEPSENTNLYIHKDRVEKYLEKNSKTRIPKKIHFIWFSKGKPFGMLYYIAVKAALYHNPSYEIYLHTDNDINYDGVYFKSLKDKIIVNKIPEPDYLNDKRVYHFQHKADYARLNILETMGGIYLDLDFLLLKPLDHFLNHKFVMGYERPNNNNFICNACIMCEPHSEVIREWTHIYNHSWGEDFVPKWMGHSVMIPSKLKKKYSRMMTIYPNRTFYPFLWNDLSILDDNDNMKMYDDSYGVHMWDTEASKTDLLPKNLEYFSKKDNAFVRLFGHLTNDLYDDAMAQTITFFVNVSGNHDTSNIFEQNYPRDKCTYLFYGDEKIDCLPDENVSFKQSINNKSVRNLLIELIETHQSDYYFLTDTTHVLSDPNAISKLILTEKDIISPMLISHKNNLFSNFWGAVDNTGYYARSSDYVDIVTYTKKGIWNAVYLSSSILISKNRILDVLNELKTNPLEFEDFDMYFCRILRQKYTLNVMNKEVYGKICN